MRILVLGLCTAFLSSCCSQQNWIRRSVASPCPQYCSTLVQHVPDTDFGSIEVQLLRTECGIEGFLGIYCGTIAPHKQCEHEAAVVIEIAAERTPYSGYRMEGGQTVRLPNEATEQIIAALQRFHCVTIYMHGYQTTLTPEDFPSDF